MIQRFCFPLKNKGFLFVKNCVIVSYMYWFVVPLSGEFTAHLAVRKGFTVVVGMTNTELSDPVLQNVEKCYANWG